MARERVSVADLPEEWRRGPLAEVLGICLELIRELDGDVGARRALNKVIERVREIQRREP